MITLRAAATPELVDVARELIREYAKMPHVIGRWMDPGAEIDTLPGDYAPPHGTILLAIDDANPVGCGCIRPFDEPGSCEMKRLYVKPSARGRGVGEILVRALVHEGVAMRYITMKLDTAPDLAAARALYTRLGFREIPRYGSNVPDISICYELDLTTS